ncbi:hypothetical protein AAW14_06425 [Streptomyces hygroscopicus]|nr:hypothetical protein [Streptomyces hygroscopicus]
MVSDMVVLLVVVVLVVLAGPAAWDRAREVVPATLEAGAPPARRERRHTAGSIGQDQDQTRA